MANRRRSALRTRLIAWIRNYITFSMQRPWWVLLPAALLGLAGVWGAQRLHVDSRLDALLPPDTAAARSIEELRRRVKSSSPLYLIVQSDDVDTSRKLAQKLADEVERWPESDWVMTQRDPSYFLERRLLLLETEDLSEFAEQIDEHVRWHECADLPGCTNMETTAPPLPSEADLEQAFERAPEVKALASVLGNDASSLLRTQPQHDPESRNGAAEANADSSNTASRFGELCDPVNRVCAVQASMRGDPSNLEFAAEISNRAERLFERLAQEAADPSVQFAVSGQFRNGPKMREVVTRDLATTSALSTGLVLLVILAQFRGFLSPLVLFIPIYSAIAWTAGMLSWVHPWLNLISAFTLAILTGLGMDFGLHLLSHYTTERERGEPPLRSVLRTLRGLGPSLVVAGSTTAISFCVLGLASFRGFSEMGLIAAAGITLALLAFLLLFPPLVAVVDRSERCPFAMRRFALSPWEFIRKRSRLLMLLGTSLTIVLGALAFGVGGRGLAFEYDFQRLDPKNVGHGIPWGRTLHGTNRTAIYLMADDAQALQHAADALRKTPPPEFSSDDEELSLMIPSAFIPKDQPRKLEILGELRETLERAKENVSGERLGEIERFEPLVQVRTPSVPEEMPRWVSDWLFERDGKFGTLGVLYTDLRGSDARQMEQLAAVLARWRSQYPDVRFASTVAQLGEVVPRLRQEAPLLIGLALLGALFGSALVGRSLRRVTAVLAPMLVMTGVSLGVAGLLGVNVNLYNMLVFPLAFGLSIDGAIFVSWAFSRRNLEQELPPVARAVVGSGLTTIAGFAALMSSSNPGLASLGMLAALMMGAGMLANLFWLPSVLWSTRRKED